VQFEQRQWARRGQQDFDFENAVVAEKRRLIEADRILVYCDLDRNLSDIGGLGSLKTWLQERQRAFSEAAAEFGLPAPRGLLLTGVQGCGKSLFAKAVAGYWGIPLLQLDISRLFDGAIPPEAALSRAIKTAEALSPAVLWIDEIDKAFGEESGPVSRMMGSLLGWLQDKTDPVFFVATANRVEQLPPELLRKGRFDEIFFVDLPSEEERRQILAIHILRRGRRPDQFELASLAQRANYFSGAELEQVVVAALFKAFSHERELQQVDLDVAIQETVPLYRTYEKEIKALREWAEGRARPAARDRRLIDLFNSPKT
jgi:SpoVK/Ycf46/Vps4 family AAA+-type ATPase